MKTGSEISRREFIFAGCALLPLLNTTAACAENACRPTETNARGPFHRRGAPWRTQLCGPAEPGEPLIISGRILDAGSCRPVAGAVVDVWQANAAGRYDNELPAYRADPEKFLLRGQMKTDAQGRYRFETILPGNYQDGGSWRPRHIHYIVSCPGYESLTTQCYFEGDKYNDTDFLVKRSLIIKLRGPVSVKEERKHLEGTFDIVLARTA